MATYQYDNAWQQARHRLAALEAVYDPGTIRHLEQLGVGEGWRCLEIGGGGGSIAEWLCRRVAPSGQVLATDVDSRFLEALDLPGLEVRQHNVVSDPLPEAAFDLVHARAVLAHLPEREAALGKMAAALKPGGWLLLEEMDTVSMVPDLPADSPAVAMFLKQRDAVAQLLSLAGVDPTNGRRVYGAVCAQGLLEVGAEGRVPAIRGGSPESKMFRLSATQLKPRLVSTGALSEDEIERYLRFVDNPESRWLGIAMVAAWGRKPT